VDVVDVLELEAVDGVAEALLTMSMTFFWAEPTAELAALLAAPWAEEALLATTDFAEVALAPALEVREPALEVNSPASLLTIWWRSRCAKVTMVVGAGVIIAAGAVIITNSSDRLNLISTALIAPLISLRTFSPTLEVLRVKTA
jgi:hypothetical protein